MTCAHCGRFGKRNRRFVYAKTKGEVEQRLLKLKQDSAMGTLVRPSRESLADYLAEWLRVGKTYWAGSTSEGYAISVNKHIVPSLGRLRLQQVEPRHIQGLYASLIANGAGQGVLTGVRRVLNKAFNDGLDAGRVPRNPAARVKCPKTERAPRQTLSLDEVETYLAAIAGHRLETLFVLAIFTTMREGELFGLQWSDIDFAQRAIFVKHAWKKGRDGKFELGTTKTEKSRRRIALSVLAFDSLQAHRRRMLVEKHGSTYVFCNEHTGTPLIRSNVLRRVHYPTLKTAGLPRLTFHDLRHTAATILMALNVHPKVAQERLGHSTIKTTLDLYSHATPTMQEQAVSALDERFRKQGA